jgi:acyl-CoA thioester hydrolase
MKTAGGTLKSSTSLRVIYGDTDQMGVVYYANYLRWFETGRSEFLRQIGLPYATIEARGFHFPVVEVACRYCESARYDEVVQVETELAQMGRATLTFHYRIARESDDALLASGSTKHACVDRAGRPVRIPEILHRALEAAGAKITDSLKRG